MPGFVTPVHMSEEMVPWVADLIAKGYDLPAGRADVFRAREPFEKPADRGYRYIPTRYSAEDSDTAFLADEFLKWLAVRQGAAVVRACRLHAAAPAARRAGALQRDA